MKIKSTIIVSIIAFSSISLLSVFGIKVFEAWSQVLILWEGEINPLLLIGHPHMPRYLVAYPGFLFEALLPSIGFSLYIAVFFAFNVVLLRNVAQIVIYQLPSLGIYLTFAAIHLAMNGRGVIAWTAWLLCVLVCHKISMKISQPSNQLGWIALSCLLATVSTGVFIVVILAFALVTLRNLRFRRQISLVRWLLVLAAALPICYVSLEYFLIAVQKNMEFYGGGIEGIFNMLEHGVGVILFEINIPKLVVLWFMACSAIVMMFLLMLGRRLSLLDSFILLSLTGGLFGFTVLTMLLPLLLLKIQIMLRPLKALPRRPNISGSSARGRVSPFDCKSLSIFFGNQPRGAT